ncbi:UDP-N-acetylmuramyl pentapeptide phosphotransferase/UDP-N-acetylglucosamine-1-phosphate transferase [Sinosporangium album]|uniref:UDP-N-acetylmuramyl pentapeptide phosphotransferase/UDP-N-acetylglucosamine-1-phosphate transferase n=1 Tax=Sinosporangium album TaxID=504805 RepID=A0A1G7V323_9ACTN|nr:MraY family glycosyltransferase [Sinosporangium album]SDG54166.1 UDP-N-acetylmuramyl pentapeptide phosphotransferase/UDP-N-acetylglucosamine-1-phosphate transferase [Sinosporangium album]
MREYLLIALAAAAVTYLLVPLVRVFAIRIGAMPEVRDRDVHTKPTPRLGGLAMYGGLVAGLIMADQLKHSGTVLADDRAMWALICAGGLIVVTGFLDDWWGMDALIKLGGQVGAAGLLVWFGLSLPWIPGPNGDSYTLDSTLSTVVTILVVVVTINAVNFVDGLDGLAAGIVCIAGIAMWGYSIVLSQAVSNGTRINLTAIITAILIGMCLGFLPHNFHPAKIFMGDTGAMLIGLVLASSIVTVTPVDPAAINRFPIVLPLLLPIAVMLLPLLDLTSAVVRRTSYGQSPFAPDRGHLHHRLLDIGHSHRRTVLIMYAWTFLFAAAVVGLSVGGVPLIVFPVTVLLAVGVLVLMALPRWRLRRKNGGSHAMGHSPEPEREPRAAARDEARDAASGALAPPAPRSGARPRPVPQPMAAPVSERFTPTEDLTQPARRRPPSAGRLPRSRVYEGPPPHTGQIAAVPKAPGPQEGRPAAPSAPETGQIAAVPGRAVPQGRPEDGDAGAPRTAEHRGRPEGSAADVPRAAGMRGRPAEDSLGVPRAADGHGRRSVPQPHSGDTTGPVPKVMPTTDSTDHGSNADSVELIDDTAVFPAYRDSRSTPPRRIP